MLAGAGQHKIRRWRNNDAAPPVRVAQDALLLCRALTRRPPNLAESSHHTHSARVQHNSSTPLLAADGRGILVLQRRTHAARRCWQAPDSIRFVAGAITVRRRL